MKKTLSIIIPVKNEQNTLPSLFKSIYDLNSYPEELIFVDNHSDDNTKKIILDNQPKCKELDFDLIYLTCDHGNQIEARDIGFRHATNEVIATIDADTVLSRNWVNAVKTSFKKEIVAIGGPVRFRNWGWINYIFPLSYHLIFRTWPFSKAFYLWGNNMAMLKSAYLKINGFDGLREMIKKLDLYDPEDDVYISFKLKKVGKLKQIKKMKASALARDVHDENRPQNRLWMQLVEYMKVRKYMKDYQLPK